MSEDNPYGCDENSDGALNPCTWHWTDDTETAGPTTPGQRWYACHLGYTAFCDG